MKKVFLFLFFLVCFIDGFGQKFQSFTISNEKNNFVYTGWLTPINAFADNCSCDSLFLTTDNGTIESIGQCKYFWYPKTTGKTWVSLKHHSNNDTTLIGKSMFEVKEFPDPVISIANKKKGEIKKSDLAAQLGLIPYFEGFDLDINMMIESFKIVIIRDTTVLYIKDMVGNKFTKDFSDFVKTLEASDLVIFSQIKIKFPDGTVRVMQPIELTIE